MRGELPITIARFLLQHRASLTFFCSITNSGRVADYILLLDAPVSVISASSVF
jgi:hypothetical protein